MNLDGATVLTYTYIRTVGSCFTVHDVQERENTFQGMLGKNAEKYPERLVYSWSAPSFLSKGLWIPIRDLLLT